MQDELDIQDLAAPATQDQVVVEQINGTDLIPTVSKNTFVANNLTPTQQPSVSCHR